MKRKAIITSIALLVVVMICSCVQYKPISNNVRLVIPDLADYTYIQMYDPETYSWYEAEETPDGKYEFTEKGKKDRDRYFENQNQRGGEGGHG